MAANHISKHSLKKSEVFLNVININPTFRVFVIIGYVPLNLLQVEATQVSTDDLLKTKNIVETDSSSLKVNIIVLYSNNKCLLALISIKVIKSGSSTEH